MLVKRNPLTRIIKGAIAMIKHTAHEAVTLWDVFKQITRGLQPEYWDHNCEQYQGKNRRLEKGQICPVCFVDENDKHHNRKDKP